MTTAIYRLPDPVCVFCGCTDERGCPEGCGWAWLPMNGGNGVCTKCEDKLAGVLQGVAMLKEL